MNSKRQPRTRDEIASLCGLVRWIDQQTHGYCFEPSERIALSAACCNTALEHQAAIALLCQHGRDISALALLRLVLEALVRGMWLHRCASDQEFIQFKNGRLEKKFATLVEEVENAIEDQDVQVLSGVFRSAWKPLNGFTHTGINMVSRQFSPGRLEATVSDDELSRALGFAGALGLVAALELLQLSSQRQDPVNAEVFLEKMAEYGNVARD